MGPRTGTEWQEPQRPGHCRRVEAGKRTPGPFLSRLCYCWQTVAAPTHCEEENARMEDERSQKVQADLQPWLVSHTPRLTGGKQVRETNPGAEDFPVGQAVKAHRETAQDHRGTHYLLNTARYQPTPRGKLVHSKGDYA